MLSLWDGTYSFVLHFLSIIFMLMMSYLVSILSQTVLTLCVAFGPPGRFNEKGISQSDTNVSVLANRNMKNFTLRGILGPPEAAAETLLRVSLAPEGSGRVAMLVAACEEERGSSSVYQFEYKIDRGEKGKPLRAISVIGARGGDTLITMTVVAPTKDWENPKYEAKLRRVAESFKLTK
jgi:hypothetical protein